MISLKGPLPRAFNFGRNLGISFETGMAIPIRGTAALAVAAAIVAATAIWLPAYRWFLLISVGIGACRGGRAVSVARVPSRPR